MAKLFYFVFLLLIFPSPGLSQEKIKSIYFENNFLSSNNKKLCIKIQSYEKKNDKLYVLDISSGELIEPSVFLQKDFIFDFFSSFWFPDSERFVVYFFVDQIHPKIYISSLSSETIKLVGKENDENGPPYSLSPDSRYIVFCRQIGEAARSGSGENFVLVLYDLETNTSRIISEDGFYWFSHKILFSSDGQHLYYLKTPKDQIFAPLTLYCYSLANGTTTIVIPKDEFEKEDLTKNAQRNIITNYLSSDSNFLGLRVLKSASEKSWYEFWIVNIKKKTLKKIRDFERPSYWNPSPSLSRVVQSKKDGTSHHHIFILNLSDDQYQQITFGENDDIQPIWTWDEKQIIFVRNNNTIWLMNSNGTKQRQIFPTIQNND